jgi:hypothetical protein
MNQNEFTDNRTFPIEILTKRLGKLAQRFGKEVKKCAPLRALLEDMESVAADVADLRDGLPTADSVERLIMGVADARDELRRWLQKIDTTKQGASAPTPAQLLEDHLGSLDRVLERAEVERIPTLGQPFDPEIHKAVGTRKTADPARHRNICTDIREGYTRDGQVLRPAEVMVEIYAARKEQEK